jgi:hypothetical protein
MHMHMCMHMCMCMCMCMCMHMCMYVEQIMCIMCVSTRPIQFDISCVVESWMRVVWCIY